MGQSDINLPYPDAAIKTFKILIIKVLASCEGSILDSYDPRFKSIRDFARRFKYRDKLDKNYIADEFYKICLCLGYPKKIAKDVKNQTLYLVTLGKGNSL